MMEKKSVLGGNIKYLYIIFIIGIIILAFANSNKETKKETPVKSEVQLNKETDLEEELSSILENIKGVGAVSVMITYENSGKTGYLYDTTYDGDMKQSQKAVVSAGSPVVYEQSMPEVKGVLVVCDGGGNTYVKKCIIEAVCALTGVYEHNVGVFERK